MPRDDENKPVYNNPAWKPPTPPKPAGPTNTPQGPVKPPKKKDRVFEEEALPPDERQALPAPAWNTGFNNNFQNGWSNPQPAANVSIPNPFKNIVPAWNNFWNQPRQNIAIPPSNVFTQPQPMTIGGYQPQGSAPFYAAIENQRNQELPNIAPNIPQANLSAQQAAMRGRTAALQGPIQPPAQPSTGGIRNNGTVRIAKGNPMIGSPSYATTNNGGGYGGGYGTTYKKKGGGGYSSGGRGGYSDYSGYSSDRVPSWLMNLTNWNFKG